MVAFYNKNSINGNAEDRSLHMEKSGNIMKSGNNNEDYKYNLNSALWDHIF